MKKIVAAITLVLLLVGCTAKLDGSSRPSFSKSLAEVDSKLSEGEKSDFNRALRYLAGDDLMKLVFSEMNVVSKDMPLPKSLVMLDGLTAKEVIKLAADQRKITEERSKKLAIERLEKSIANDRQRLEILKRAVSAFNSIKAEEISSELSGGRDVKLDFYITNRGDIPLRSLSFDVWYGEPSRKGFDRIRNVEGVVEVGEKILVSKNLSGFAETALDQLAGKLILRAPTPQVALTYAQWGDLSITPETYLETETLTGNIQKNQAELNELRSTP